LTRRPRGEHGVDAPLAALTRARSRTRLAQHDVVEQSGAPAPGGEHGERASPRDVHGLEGLGVGQGRVVGDEVRFAGEHGARGGDERRCRALAGGERVLRGGERLRDAARAGALVGAQVHVAARQREPVGLAHRRRDHHLDREVEVGDHGAHERGLLRVLLPEHGHVRRDEVEELRHDGEHAREMARPNGALPPVGHRAGHHAHARLARVDLATRARTAARRRRARLRGVAAGVARVAREVLAAARTAAG
jgi:hypothetical protein